MNYLSLYLRLCVTLSLQIVLDGFSPELESGESLLNSMENFAEESTFVEESTSVNMCGLAGFAGIKDYKTRLVLTTALTVKGIESRGGHAAGYVAITEKHGIRYGRKVGPWSKARTRFLKSAASGDMCLMHSRYATCGKKDVTSAHPFAIHRKGKVVLWGAHNGMIPDAWDCAKAHNRVCNVDSQEVFELIADGEYETIQKLMGYGVLTWVEANDPTCIKLVRLSKNSDMEIVSVKGGGIVWASTWKILSEALKAAGLEGEYKYHVEEVGRVYEIKNDIVLKTDVTGIHLHEGFNRYGHKYGWGMQSTYAALSSSSATSSSSKTADYTGTSPSFHFRGASAADYANDNTLNNSHFEDDKISSAKKRFENDPFSYLLNDRFIDEDELIQFDSVEEYFETMRKKEIEELEEMEAEINNPYHWGPN